MTILSAFLIGYWLGTAIALAVAIYFFAIKPERDQ